MATSFPDCTMGMDIPKLGTASLLGIVRQGTEICLSGSVDLEYSRTPIVLPESNSMR